MAPWCQVLSFRNPSPSTFQIVASWSDHHTQKQVSVLFHAETVHPPVVRFWLTLITALEAPGQLPECCREAKGKVELGRKWQNLDWSSLQHHFFFLGQLNRHCFLPVAMVNCPPVGRNHHPAVCWKAIPYISAAFGRESLRGQSTAPFLAWIRSSLNLRHTKHIETALARPAMKNAIPASFPKLCLQISARTCQVGAQKPWGLIIQMQRIPFGAATIPLNFHSLSERAPPPQSPELLCYTLPNILHQKHSYPSKRKTRSKSS